MTTPISSHKVEEPPMNESAVPVEGTITRAVTDGLEEDDAGVISTQQTITATSSQIIPTQIPLEPVEKQEDEDHEVEEEDDEDEYEYEYEEDDDVRFSGFLMNDSANFLSSSSSTSPTMANASSVVATVENAVEAPATIRDDEESTAPEPAKPKWRQPSQQAVDMSLRAEQETSGGKRRLAQDLYRIMNQDTEDAGFSLQPTLEDSMKQWTIQLFQFDPDSNLAKDMKVLGLEHLELEMNFPDQYPFEPPFVRVVRPRFKRQTGFVMNGALCMELLTKDGWNPVNDIESVIVSIRSLLVVGDGRLEAAYNMSHTRYEELLAAATTTTEAEKSDAKPSAKRKRVERSSNAGGTYTTSEAEAAYSHLSDYHKKKGWDSSGWWARKG